MRLKKPIKLLGLAFALFLTVLSVQFVWFYRILQWPWDGGHENQRMDVIAVFRGAEGRVEKGYELANAGVAPLLVISPSSKTNLTTLDRMYRRSREFDYLLEPRADTTFENALLVGRLIKTYQKHTTVLVTSDYHMPRSYLLLRMALLGTGTTILACPAEAGRFSSNPLAWSKRQKKQIYNEMVEFWGSLFEMGRYLLFGDIPPRSLKRNELVSFLRGLLLFEL